MCPGNVVLPAPCAAVQEENGINGLIAVGVLEAVDMNSDAADKVGLVMAFRHVVGAATGETVLSAG